MNDTRMSRVPMCDAIAARIEEPGAETEVEVKTL